MIITKQQLNSPISHESEATTIKKKDRLKILLFAASFREGSLNEHLIKFASDTTMKNGGKSDFAFMRILNADHSMEMLKGKAAWIWVLRNFNRA